MGLIDEIFTDRHPVPDSVREAFGEHWCGPEELSREGVCIARYPKVGGDGQPAEVWCSALPARFYEVRALESTDSSGEPDPAFTLSTGATAEESEVQWAALTAKLIAEGMLCLDR